ncbi:MAG: 6,7-dimethyl-8-ribityllumazine synthase [Actinomycetia bacterium]|nr:6,7-dimethyl-8-ribityllumazine synthase [Actinomycetes bacterium]
MRIDNAPSGEIRADGLRIGVVTAAFNAPVTDGLKTGAVTYLKEVGAQHLEIIDAPGAFELPLIAQALATSGYDAVVCLGAVIEGDTDHYEHVAHRASEGLMRVQLDTGVPVSFGILTTRKLADALARSGPGRHNKGREAAEAAVRAALILRDITPPPSPTADST